MRHAWVVSAAVATLEVACGARTALDGPAIVDASPRDVTVPDAGHDVVVPDVASPMDVVEVSLVDVVTLQTGCADGTREGFRDDTTFPNIAGCSGGFQVPGVMPFNPGTAPACATIATFDTVDPACNRQGGNDGANPTGVGCNVADLCAVGWHVCVGATDVTMHSPSGCDGATTSGDPPLFFTTRQSSDGCYDCATGALIGPSCNSMDCVAGCAETASTSNDVFGCGNFGKSSGLVGCGPLDETSDNLCGAISGTWSCLDDGTGYCEAYVIVHTSASFGGAVCCTD
jgi:hypothetical protein